MVWAAGLRTASGWLPVALANTVKVMPFPTEQERAEATNEVNKKFDEIRALFKDIEGIAEQHRLHVTWDGLVNMDSEEYWYSQARVHYMGGGAWRSSSRDDC